MAAATIPTVGIFNQPVVPSSPAGGGGLFGTAWYYNSRTGAVTDQPTLVMDGVGSLGIGWHGPFDTQTDALYFYTSNAAANPGWKAPAGLAGNLENIVSPVVAPVAGAVSTTLGAVDAVPKFLSMLTSGNLWLRIAEGAAGLILLAIGVNALFKGKPASAVTGTAAKLAPLALA